MWFNVACYLPKADAGKLLMILQQIDLWRVSDAQASRATTQDRPSSPQRPPQA
jgi:hypothetical protein